MWPLPGQQLDFSLVLSFGWMLSCSVFKLLEISLIFLRLASNSSQGWSRATFNVPRRQSPPGNSVQGFPFPPRLLEPHVALSSAGTVVCSSLAGLPWLCVASSCGDAAHTQPEGTLYKFSELFACTGPSSFTSCHENPGHWDLPRLQTLLLQLSWATRLCLVLLIGLWSGNSLQDLS